MISSLIWLFGTIWYASYLGLKGWEIWKLLGFTIVIYVTGVVLGAIGVQSITNIDTELAATAKNSEQ